MPIIDFRAVAHLFRRVWWRIVAGPYCIRNCHVSQCIGCGKKLQADEREFYEVHCERCEGVELARWE